MLDFSLISMPNFHQTAGNFFNFYNFFDIYMNFFVSHKKSNFDYDDLISRSLISSNFLSFSLNPFESIIEPLTFHWFLCRISIKQQVISLIFAIFSIFNAFFLSQKIQLWLYCDIDFSQIYWPLNFFFWFSTVHHFFFLCQIGLNLWLF